MGFLFIDGIVLRTGKRRGTYSVPSKPSLWDRLNYDSHPYLHVHPGCPQDGVRVTVRDWNDEFDVFKPRWWFSQDREDYA